MIEKPMCAETDLKNCRSCTKKILGWTILGNAFVAGLKLSGGIFANSSALVADGFQSISCVATSILIMVSLAYSQRQSDENFPYGYAKVEFIVALSAFSVLIGLGLFIVLSSLLGILRREFVQPDILVLPIAIAAAFLTYMMYRYNFCAGTKLDSPGMIANGCHAGADLFSSGAVILSIVISQLGPQFAVSDKIAALIVGIIIIKDSLVHWKSNLQAILDQVPDPGLRRDIEAVITRVHPGYRAGAVKFKRVGKKFWIGINLRCPMTGTVQQAEASMTEMRGALLKQLSLIGEVDFFVETIC